MRRVEDGGIGNGDFAAFSNARLGERCDRIYNTLDIIPAGWESATLKPLPHIYKSGGIKMSWGLWGLFQLLYWTLRGYRQIDRGDPLTWTIQADEDVYLKQAGVQHYDSYPHVLGVPELLTVIVKK